MLAVARTFPGRDKICGMSEAVRWLTQSEMLAWRGLVRSTTGVLAVLDNELQAEHGLSLGDYEVLVHLSEAPDRAIRMSELAETLRLSPSGITRRIDGLVKSGFVERRPCPSDRRGSNAVLTELGMKMLATAAPTHLRGVREHFVDRLTEEQLAQLATALASLDIDEQRAAGGCDGDD
jgi:DNA-binding MarR family transcriptional regulator